jgi:hypothetical protein
MGSAVEEGEPKGMEPLFSLLLLEVTEAGKLVQPLHQCQSPLFKRLVLL